MVDYTSKASLQAAIVKTATKMGLSINSIDMWIPYKREANSPNLTYVNVYSNRTINKELWGPNLPSPGAECVHCYHSYCTDDACNLVTNTHMCIFPSGAPIMRLLGFCPDTVIGNDEGSRNTDCTARH